MNDRPQVLAETPDGWAVHVGRRSKCFSGWRNEGDLEGWGVSTHCDRSPRVAGTLPVVPTDEEVEAGELVAPLCCDCRSRLMFKSPDGVEIEYPHGKALEGHDRVPEGFGGPLVVVDLEEYGWRDRLEKEAALR